MMGYNPFSLEGKTVFVTGASSGIGRAIAVECAKLKARVVISGTNETRLKETILLLESPELQHTYFVADLTDEEAIKSLVEALPILDGFVSNAGNLKLNLTQFLTMSDIESLHKINLYAPMLLTKYLVKKKKMKNFNQEEISSRRL